MRTRRSRSSCPGHRRSSALTLALALACALGTGHARADDLLAQLTATAAARQVAVLEAIVNGRSMGPVFVVVERGEAKGIDAGALRAWRVTTDPAAPFRFEERAFISVTDLPGAKINVEQRTQRLLVELPPRLFDPTDVRFAADATPPVAAPVMAGVLNYTLFGYSSRDDSFASGFFEAGASGAPGSLILTASANTAAPAGQTTHRVVRYDTTFRRDDPAGLRTLNIGDTFTQNGSNWGRSVRFGGLQFGTNFALQPNLITYPLQGFAGTAVVPSSVDVLVNGSRIATQPVQPGPFTVNDVPLVSGAGDVQLVVRDAFGQQQVISQPFYASRRLLKSGLSEFQINAGAIRRNYGLASFDYGSAMGAGHWRGGLSDRFTMEIRAEGDDQTRATGVTGDFGLGLYGTATAGVAVSDGRAGSGDQWIAGYEYLGRRFNLAARARWASPDFRAVGDEGLPIVRRQTYASAGANLGTMGSLGVAWASQRYRALPDLDTATLTYTATLSRRVFLTMSVARTWSVVDQTSAYASLTVALDGRTSATGEASGSRAGGQGGSSYAAWSIQQALPTDEGAGFRVRVATRDQVDAGAGYTWPYGTYTLEASRFQDASAVRATATGGIGYVGGRAFASRPITESFGLVQVGDIEGVLVFHEGNPIGRTDEGGAVVVQRMNPYVSNRITIDERDLPMDVTIRSREQRVVPAFRSGTVVHYEAVRRVSAILEVRTEDGQHLPAGSEAAMDNSALRFIVGDAGEMYVPDLPTAARFTVDRPGSACAFEVRLPATQHEIQPKLGPFVCRAERR